VGRACSTNGEKRNAHRILVRTSEVCGIAQICKTHYFCDNSHTFAPELKTRSKVVFDCLSYSCVLFSSFQSGNLQSYVYVPSSRR
jgi:hypothetical protein